MTLAEWQALTPEAKAAHNAEGESRGVHACPVCGDRQLLKPFHDTTYHEGEQIGAVAKVRTADGWGETRPAKFMGSRGVVALCEECWEHLTPAERLPHYEGRHAARRGTIPSIAKRHIDRMLQEDPDDVRRHAADHKAHDAEWEAIKTAVLAGE